MLPDAGPGAPHSELQEDEERGGREAGEAPGDSKEAAQSW